MLRNLDPSCELTRLNQLATIAMHQQVFGPLDKWTAADVRLTSFIPSILPPY